MSDKQPRTFALRRLSPFQGFTQVIEAGDGQASSNNGIDWRIQVRIQTPLNQWGSMDGSQPSHQTVLFGFWSSEGGFHRVPLPPMVSSKQVEIAAQAIIDELLFVTRTVPFKYIDRYELWLLDEQEQLPLVLLASASDANHLPAIRRPQWQATVLSDHSFTRAGSSEVSNYPGNSPRDQLNSLVQKAAGQNPVAQWFVRNEDGTGTGIAGINLPDELSQRQLSAAQFPELLLKEEWSNEEAKQLVKDYLDWQAPFLLTLPHLQKLTRKRLEQAAFKQPFKVEGQYKLWPEVMDEEKLKAVLVEAQMRRSNPQAGEQPG